MRVQRVGNLNQYNHKTKPTKQQTFKGYFACPIKEIYIQSDWTVKMYPLVKELKEKCGKYFDVVVQLRNSAIKAENVKNHLGFIEESRGKGIWSQDNKLFLESNELLILKNHPKATSAEDLAEVLGLKTKDSTENIIGGNCFLGKKQNGENFALIGKRAIFNSFQDYDSAIRDLKIKAENLHIIPQPDFHIDMVIRPLNYPYVLVGDPNLSKKVVHSNSQKKFLKEINLAKEIYIKCRNFATADETAANLEKSGFKPIKVPGIFGKDKVNFMNAIVHQDTDGKLIYITNKTHFDGGGIDYEGVFKKYLKKHVPQIKEVIFIDGEGFVNENITKYSGGIHCMTCERPDFENWNRILNK